MKVRRLLVVGASLALVAAGCGDDDDAESPPTETESATPATEAPATDPPATDAPSTEAPATEPPTSEAATGDETPVKVAFITKFPVEFFTAMEDAAKEYAAANEGVEIEYFSCQSPADVDCQIAQIEDAAVQGFDAIVITPMGNDVIPALDAAADGGVVVVLADNDLADFTKKTAVAATDNVAGGQLAGEYLKSVLKSGDTIGLMEGVRGVPALDARIQGVQDALEGTGVEIVIGGAETKCDSAQGATVAEDLLTRVPELTAIYSACDDPAIAAADGRQGPGQASARRRLRRLAGCRPGDHRRRYERQRSLSSPAKWRRSACRPRSMLSAATRWNPSSIPARNSSPPTTPTSSSSSSSSPSRLVTRSLLVVTSRRRRRSHQEDSCACRPPVSHVCSTSPSRPTRRADCSGGGERGHDRRPRRRRRALPDLA